MDTGTYIIIGIAIAVVAAALGWVAASMMSRRNAKSQANGILADARREAENLKNDKILEGREEALRITAESESNANSSSTSSRARTSAPAMNSKACARPSRPSRTPSPHVRRR